MCITYTPSKYVPDFSLAGGGGEAGRERPERWKCVNMLGLGWAGEGRGVRVWSWALQLDRPLPGPSHRHHPRPADTSNITPSTIQWPEYTHPATHQPTCRGKSSISPSLTRSVVSYVLPNSADLRSARVLVRSVSQCPNEFDLDILPHQKVSFVLKFTIWNVK